MPHYKTLFNPDYIGAYALNGEDLTVKIKSVRPMPVKGEGGREQECVVLTLEGQKPMILNATNAKSIAKLHGTDYEAWAGKSITLYTSTTSLKGETVECVRIRPTVAEAKKRDVTDERFSQALTQIEAGKYSLDKLLKTYNLTPEQTARLPKQIEGETV